MKKLGPILVLSLAPVITWANIIPTGTTITGAGPIYTWTYNLQLSSDQNVNSGNPPTDILVPPDNVDFAGFFTIYDFAGYQVDSCDGPIGWQCTAQLLGFTPSDVIPIDNPTLYNLTWAYTAGSDILGQPDGVDLGDFSAHSIYDTITKVSYTSRGIANTGAQEGTIADNVGNTDGPMGVPEPPLVLLLGLGIGILATTIKATKRSRLGGGQTSL
jgi:hypothetical protein